MARLLTAVLIFITLMGASWNGAFAQWQVDGIVVNSNLGVPRGTYPLITKGATGGDVLVLWANSYGSGELADEGFYVEKLNRAGQAYWNVDGVLVAQGDTPSFGWSVDLLPDAEGGFWMSGNVENSGRVFHVSASGRVDVEQYSRMNPRLVSDGKGGVICASDFLPQSGNHDVRVFHFGPNGEQLWVVDVFATTADEYDPIIIADNDYGAIIGAGIGVYQRVDSLGNSLWGPTGVLVESRLAMSDGYSGILVTNPDGLVERYDDAGSGLWQTRFVDSSPSPQNVQIAGDDTGHGAVIVWEDSRELDPDIRAQHVDEAGALHWMTGGIPVCDERGEQTSPVLATDPTYGVVVAWRDNRTTRSEYPELYSQRLTFQGDAVWPAGGILIAHDIGNEVNNYHSVAIAGDHPVWVWRAALDVRAQGLLDDYYAEWGFGSPRISDVADVPHDQGGALTVQWQASHYDVAALRTISHYSVWRAVDEPASRSTVASASAIISENRSPAVILEDGHYWEWLTNLQAAEMSRLFRVSMNGTLLSPELMDTPRYNRTTKGVAHGQEERPREHCPRYQAQDPPQVLL